MPDLISEELLTELRNQAVRDMSELRITDFQATPDRDHDGDPILRIQVIYDEAGGEPNVAHILTLARHVRPLLPDTFPIFRFLTAREFADDAR